MNFLESDSEYGNKKIGEEHVRDEEVSNEKQIDNPIRVLIGASQHRVIRIKFWVVRARTLFQLVEWRRLYQRVSVQVVEHSPVRDCQDVAQQPSAQFSLPI